MAAEAALATSQQPPATSHQTADLSDSESSPIPHHLTSSTPTTTLTAVGTWTWQWEIAVPIIRQRCSALFLVAELADTTNITNGS